MAPQNGESIGDLILLSERNILFDVLIQKCKNLLDNKFIDFTIGLRFAALTADERRELVSRRIDGCAPLFIAIQHGNFEACKFLFEECNPDIEQRGEYKLSNEDIRTYQVTPLWLAVKLKKIEIIQFLIEKGARVNSMNGNLLSINDLLESPELSSSMRKHKLYRELLKECCEREILLVPRLRPVPQKLRKDLDKLSFNNRKELVSRMTNGCTPLFEACRSRLFQMCTYLVTNCGAEVEQKCNYSFTVSHNIGKNSKIYVEDQVTPLWAATAYTSLPLIQLFLEHGADINTCDFSGRTPLYVACQQDQLDTVKYLVGKGADVQKTDFQGKTCLMTGYENTCTSYELTKFLLENGAQTIINKLDCKLKSALYYTIKVWDDVEIVKLLIHHGALLNEDVLLSASINGQFKVLRFLLTSYSEIFPKRAIANAYELIGSTFFQRYDHSSYGGNKEDLKLAKEFWIQAELFRGQHSLYPKELANQFNDPELEYIKMNLFKSSEEFESFEVLKDILSSEEKMRIQSVLIDYRILGRNDPLLIKRCADSIFDRISPKCQNHVHYFEEHQNFIDMEIFMLKLMVDQETLFDAKEFSAYSCTILVCHLLNLHKERNLSYKLRFKDLLFITDIYIKLLLKWKDLLKIRPVSFPQQYRYDAIMECVTHLFYILNENFVSPEQKAEIRDRVREAVRINPRTEEGNSLLHLSVIRWNRIVDFALDERSEIIFNPDDDVFPNADIVKLLIECGADIDPINKFHSTPLHYATCAENFNPEVVKILLDKKAHLDPINCYGLRPGEQILMRENANDISLCNYITLKCLAANVVCVNNIPYDDSDCPLTLNYFIESHRH